MGKRRERDAVAPGEYGGVGGLQKKQLPPSVQCLVWAVRARAWAYNTGDSACGCMGALVSAQELVQASRCCLLTAPVWSSCVQVAAVVE